MQYTEIARQDGQDHPKHPKLAIFNGLGTRGVIQGPCLAAEFNGFLTQGQKIDQSTDIHRFIRFFDHQ